MTLRPRPGDSPHAGPSRRETASGQPVARPADLLLVAASLAGRHRDADVAAVFGDAPAVVVPDDDLVVRTPWEGPLFELVPRAAAGAPAGRRPRLGLLVPVVWLGTGPAPRVVVVSDHVDLRLRGPLTGRRPDGGPQVFPSLTGIYHPASTAAAAGGRVYSEVAAAGVGDARRLTPFERRELAFCACAAAADRLVDAVVVAALHGYGVLACGVPRGEDDDRQTERA